MRVTVLSHASDASSGTSTQPPGAVRLRTDIHGRPRSAIRSGYRGTVIIDTLFAYGVVSFCRECYTTVMARRIGS